MTIKPIENDEVVTLSPQFNIFSGVLLHPQIKTIEDTDRFVLMPSFKRLSDMLTNQLLDLYDQGILPNNDYLLKLDLVVQCKIANGNADGFRRVRLIDNDVDALAKIIDKL